jgi:TetR/AcrR family tetracycline transcriptional repressor
MARVRSPAPALSRHDLIALTAELIARDGVRRISMRQVAGELGVSATAIYYHVRDKQELLELTAEAIVSQIRLDRQIEDWREELRLLLRKQQNVLRRYPGIGRFLFDHRDAPAAVAWMDIFLGVLLRAGFEGSAAVDAFGRIVSHVNPLFLLGDTVDGDQASMARPGVEAVVKAQPGQFAAVEKLLPHLKPVSFDDVFTSGADAIVESLAAELKATRRRNGSKRR